MEFNALKDYHVIDVAMLGNGESSSPSNTPGFPKILRYEDCIHAQYLLVTQHLGLSSLDAVIGFSMGGQQAYYWAAMYGSNSGNPFVKAAIAICSSARTSGHNYAFLDGPIGALIESKDYDGGKYKASGVVPVHGLRAFERAYTAWMHSAEWYEQELWRKMGAQSVAGYTRPWDVEEGGEADYVKEEWDPEDVLALARMWQAGDVSTVGPVGANGTTGEPYGSLEAALAAITIPVLVMPCKTDQYFNWKAGEKEARLLKRGTFRPIESIWGHMAGAGANAEDQEWLDRQIEEFLSKV